MGSISHSQEAATAVSLRIEAARDAADNELAAVSAELRTKMAQALSGFISTVPSFRIVSMSQTIECESIVADEVSEALQEMEPMHYLLMALKDSPCPLVSKLRVSIINQYAHSTAERVAEARDE
jgi:hypothetical protein